MMKIMLNSVLLLTVMTILAGCIETTQKSIKVSGDAYVYADPELARFDFSIEERGKVLSVIKNTVDNKTAKLVKLCKSLGIDPKDITAAEISIEPQYNYENNVFTGYHISRNVHANLYDLNKYSAFIEGAVTAGITNIQNISLELKEENSMEYEALEKAIAKARQKAEFLATKSGVKLGEVLNISESKSGFLQDEYKFEGFLEKRAAPEADIAVFEPGQLTVSRTVHVVYGID
jgi:uncharacterized protein YggE